MEASPVMAVRRAADVLHQNGPPEKKARVDEEIQLGAESPPRERVVEGESDIECSDVEDAVVPTSKLDGTGASSMWQGSGAKDDFTSPRFNPEQLGGKVVSGKPIPYQILASAYETIENLKGSGAGSKKAQVVALTNALRTVLYFRVADFVPAIYMSVNKLAPDYDNVETGVGDHLLLQTVSDVTSRSEKALRQDLKDGKVTDLGEAAMKSRGTQAVMFPPPPLTITRVFTDMHKVAKLSGNKSGQAKKEVMKKMLVAAKGPEIKFIVRMINKKMRIGINHATMLMAVAHAVALTPCKDGKALAGDARDCISSEADFYVRMAAMEAAVRRAFSEQPSYDSVVGALLEGYDETNLAKKCHIRVGTPVKPMLAKPTRGVTEVMEKLGDKACTAEYKYDGERAQVHVMGGKNGKIDVYSRNSENLTEKYPDLITVVRDHLMDGVDNCIIDAEVVAFDVKEKRILPFQQLTTRKKKDVHASEVTVQVCLFPFDIMLLNGQALLSQPLRNRRDRLREALKEEEGKIMFAVRMDVTGEEEIAAFLNESIENSCEGLMIKALDVDASYEPSKRSLNWLKLKKDYLDNLGDSVDLVPIAAWYGKGKRAGFFGAYLLACYNPEEEEFQTCCRVGTGLSDEALASHHAFFQDKIIPNKRTDYRIHDGGKEAPHVYFDACVVWECKGADLSISPVHTAAIGIKHESRGIGIRFPRFLRIRPDKSPEQATDAEQIVELYEAQAVTQGQGRVDPDFY
eukprot:CAMPEP_0204257848 /NCGR_PEP_ID=MMETSP0468-20130131/4674_1 /ASSEMBLY_ACC=CAM_ASM_000383 /TAXON_ID=2969 /ORGANISM="Oxyrrhis marina" /LENGTH=743 /DNA_ID=CAMNT_0051232013 /DNA_START=16 /DNA_END=2247 /DNA_ORIENTATION=+